MYAQASSNYRLYGRAQHFLFRLDVLRAAVRDMLHVLWIRCRMVPRHRAKVLFLLQELASALTLENCASGTKQGGAAHQNSKTLRVKYGLAAPPHTNVVSKCWERRWVMWKSCLHTFRDELMRRSFS